MCNWLTQLLCGQTSWGVFPLKYQVLNTNPVFDWLITFSRTFIFCKLIETSQSFILQCCWDLSLTPAFLSHRVCCVVYSVQCTHIVYTVSLILSSVPIACILGPFCFQMYPPSPTTVLVWVGFSALLYQDFELYFRFLLPPGYLLPIWHPEPPAHCDLDPVHPTPVIPRSSSYFQSVMSVTSQTSRSGRTPA